MNSFRKTMFLIIHCTTKDLSVLVVPPAQEPSGRTKISGPVAGGGKTAAKRNADCMNMQKLKKKKNPDGGQQSFAYLSTDVRRF